jgi:hypothetical protein
MHVQLNMSTLSRPKRDKGTPTLVVLSSAGEPTKIPINVLLVLLWERRTFQIALG